MIPSHVAIRPDTTDAIVFNEVWEEDVYRMREHGHQVAGRPALDLGANVGAFTLRALDLGATRVHAVEPIPENLAQLRRNTEPFTAQVIIHPEAVTGRHGPSSLAIVGGQYVPWTASVEGRAVRTVKLEDLLGREDEWGVLKCDIEGGEFAAFSRVCADLMSRVHVIVMEFHGRGMGEHCAWIADGSLGRLVETLSETHHVQTMGRASVGGQLWAWRY